MRFVSLLALVACGSDRPTCPSLDDTAPTADCTGGCVPTPLASSGARTSNLVMTATAFAWLDHDAPTADRVMTVPHAGGTPTEMVQLRRIPGHATHLRTNGTALAWNEGPTVYVDGRTLAVTTTRFDQTRFALDATNLYVPAEGALDVLALADGAFLGGWQFEPVDIAIDPEGPLLASCSGTYRARLDDGRLERLSALSLCAVRIVKNTAYVFVNAYIASCDVSGLVRVDLATGEAFVAVLDDQIGSIAADDAHVYYVTMAGLHRVGVDGGQPALVLAGTIDSFTLDASNIYVLAGGKLSRIAK